MKPICVLLAAMALVSSFSFSARAESQKDVIRACEGDIKRYCGQVQPGGDRIKMCLKANSARLSAPCKQAIMFAAAEKK